MSFSCVPCLRDGCAAAPTAEAVTQGVVVFAGPPTSLYSAALGPPNTRNPRRLRILLARTAHGLPAASAGEQSTWHPWRGGPPHQCHSLRKLAAASSTIDRALRQRIGVINGEDSSASGPLAPSKGTTLMVPFWDRSHGCIRPIARVHTGRAGRPDFKGRTCSPCLRWFGSCARRSNIPSPIRICRDSSSFRSPQPTPKK
jgi:hypothetical protein